MGEKPKIAFLHAEFGTEHADMLAFRRQPDVICLDEDALDTRDAAQALLLPQAVGVARPQVVRHWIADHCERNHALRLRIAPGHRLTDTADRDTIGLGIPSAARWWLTPGQEMARRAEGEAQVAQSGLLAAGLVNGGGGRFVEAEELTPARL